MNDPAFAVELDTTAQEILLAASNHDIEALKPFLRAPGAASVQDPETGTTPLHAAIAACGIAKGQPASQPDATTEIEKEERHEPELEHSAAEAEEEAQVDIEKAKATLKELFLAGAIWNDLDVADETPGCLAWRLGQKELYEIVVEAGVRAEMLMNLMGGYELLGDADDEEEDEEATEEAGREEGTNGTAEPSAEEEQPATSTTILPPDNDLSTLSSHYLSSTLTQNPTTLLDASRNGVMMAWETPIMSLSATLLAPTSGLRILNIGFGMGIIDGFFAATKPKVHHIVEAHPDVLKSMRGGAAGDGEMDWGAWEAREGNKVLEGRWQDVVQQLVEAEELYDAIYFDTFAEPYLALKEFFSEYVIALLAPDGKFGFFNGMGADRRVCYDVYTRVVEGDLWEAGLGVEWREVGVEVSSETDGEWEGVRRRYWTLEKYRLPVCSFLG